MELYAEFHKFLFGVSEIGLLAALLRRKERTRLESHIFAYRRPGVWVKDQGVAA